MRQHFDESHGKHHAGNKGQCKEKSGTSRQAARTDVVALRVADHTELADQSRKVKGAQPLACFRHLIEDAGKDDDGKDQSDIRSDADFLFLLQLRRGFVVHDFPLGWFVTLTNPRTAP